MAAWDGSSDRINAIDGDFVRGSVVNSIGFVGRQYFPGSTLLSQGNASAVEGNPG